ncbi:MAG TPA: hypothetical protein PKE04_15970 [Clostridia bacterium]|nr:hypothetical protein [Clostridia bacterium]
MVQNRLRGKRKARIANALLRDRRLYAMLIPFFLYYAFFYFRPFSGLVIAFQDYKPLLGTAGSKYVGFENFVKFFTGPYFGRLMRNTVLLSVNGILFGFPVPIILALLFNEVRSNKARTFVQTISYMPPSSSRGLWSTSSPRPRGSSTFSSRHWAASRSTFSRGPNTSGAST